MFKVAVQVDPPSFQDPVILSGSATAAAVRQVPTAETFSDLFAGEERPPNLPPVSTD